MSPFQPSPVTRALLSCRLLALSVVVSVGGCTLAEPSRPTLVAESDARPALLATGHEGTRWIDLGMQPGPDGLLLAGRFRPQWPLQRATQIVLVQGRDAEGSVIFEQRVLAQVEHVSGRQWHHRSFHFRITLPQVSGLRSVSVTDAARPAES